MSAPSPAKPVAAALPSATILMLRDGPAGLEVFMVKRNYQIDFAGGALVFPGGKLAEGDSDPALINHIYGSADLTPDQIALRVAAIREAFEEAGLFLARAIGGKDLIDAARLDDIHHYRALLDRGEVDIGAMLAAEDLILDLAALVPFAHWITPVMMPKRFDTHFYLAAAPGAQIGAHDGQESVDSVWIGPQHALDQAAAGQLTIIFPTRMNLQKLAQCRTVADAMDAARNSPVMTVTPWIEHRDGKQYLLIPADAGYGDVAEPLDKAFR
jgi:8-oxo-dGTP pyrophosphatase MutT (NUDIX family)